MVEAKEHPMLAELAMILHGTPVTQLSVERSFSAMKIFLRAQRNKLATDVLNDLVFVKANQ